ncbi:MAG: AAA family ATPase, partial [Verrucomicrobiae bacterium]|nr:AAA family ATPase [Verrucomicrobiae bacterium]
MMAGVQSIERFLVVLLVFFLPFSAFGFGDRGLDVDQRYPDDALVQNGGPIYDVRRPPEGCRAAKGDGKSDDTEALRDAFDFLKKRHQAGYMAGASNLHVYLPNGVYLVSGPIFYRGDVALDGGEGSGVENPPRRYDILRVRIIGQSRARTVLRLADKSPGFDDPSKPQVLLSFQHPQTTFNNAPGYNVLRNLIIDTGSGNPGAIAVRFQGAKRTDLRNVTIRSSDGQGVCGLWMPSGAMQGCVMDTSIVGFDYGIHVTKLKEGEEMTPAFEHVTLFSQRKAGMRIDNGGVSVRRLRCDQSQTGAPAIEVAGDGVQLVLVESALVGRDREVETFRQLVMGLAGRRGGILTITGDKGMGKSFLVAYVREQFIGQNALMAQVPWPAEGGAAAEVLLTWIQVRCRSYEQARPYSMWINMLRRWLEMSEDEPLLQARARLRERCQSLWPQGWGEYYPYLVALLSMPPDDEFSPDLLAGHAEGLRQQLFLVLRSWVQELARCGPLVLALSDMHWIDATSLDVLRYCLPLCEQEALLWVLV